MRFLFAVMLAAICLAIAPSADAVEVTPQKSWESAPGSLPVETRNSLNDYVRALDTSSLMIIQHGKVIYQYGDVQQLSYIASARKSVLAMLYGPHVAKGAIQLETTLKDLGMSDVGGLLPIERRATVRDILSARSGVYHPASYAGDRLDAAPPRGNQEPGAYWLYSNWDFNAAGAVFEKMTGKSIYDALRDQLATPLEMQDFSRARQHKEGDATKSEYLAYPMWLSTRDMARLGLLMLRRGQWNGLQLIPKDWIERITSLVTARRDLHPDYYRQGPWGYGYMWWVWDRPAAVAFQGAYTAWGAYGQYITVLPKLDMVIAHKTVPINREVGPGDYLRLLDRITGKIPASRYLLPILWKDGRGAAVARSRTLQKQPGNVALDENDLYAVAMRQFRAKRYSTALAILRLNAGIYPDSVKTQLAISRSEAAMGHPTKALEVARAILDRDPSDASARAYMARLGRRRDGHAIRPIPAGQRKSLAGQYRSRDVCYIVSPFEDHLKLQAFENNELNSEEEVFEDDTGGFFVPADETTLQFTIVDGQAQAVEGIQGQSLWRAEAGKCL